jgi:hypothetical protein
MGQTAPMLANNKDSLCGVGKSARLGNVPRVSVRGQRTLRVAIYGLLALLGTGTALALTVLLVGPSTDMPRHAVSSEPDAESSTIAPALLILPPGQAATEFVALTAEQTRAAEASPETPDRAGSELPRAPVQTPPLGREGAMPTAAPSAARVIALVPWNLAPSKTSPQSAPWLAPLTPIAARAVAGTPASPGTAVATAALSNGTVPLGAPIFSGVTRSSASVSASPANTAASATAANAGTSAAAHANGAAGTGDGKGSGAGHGSAAAAGGHDHGAAGNSNGPGGHGHGDGHGK